MAEPIWHPHMHPKNLSLKFALILISFHRYLLARLLWYSELISSVSSDPPLLFHSSTKESHSSRESFPVMKLV